MGAWFPALPGPVTAAGAVCLLFAVVSFTAAVKALFQRRLWKSTVHLSIAAALGLLLVPLLLLAAGIRGYEALTAEQTAAVVFVAPAGEQRFIARFSFADGHAETYALSGDQLYVDARILKWKYWANLIGLHTAYELDRVAGRYSLLEDERSKPRTLHSLASERPVDLFGLRRRFELLAPVYDAEYGSAVYVPAEHPAKYEILVSATGLLARPLGPAADPILE